MRNITGPRSSSRSLSEVLWSPNVTTAASPMPAASTKQRHARRSRRLGEKKSKTTTERAKDSQTARVLVATIASGNATRKRSASAPRSRLRRNEFSATRPSKFSVTPLATACRKGPRAVGVIPETFVQNVAGKNELFRIDHEEDGGKAQVSQHHQPERLESLQRSSIVED